MRLFLLFTALFAVSCTKDSTGKNDGQYCWKCTTQQAGYPERVFYDCTDSPNAFPTYNDDNGNSIQVFCTRTN